MSVITLKTWRHVDADQVWQLGLPANWCRNKTHLRQIVSDYRKSRDAEVYIVLHNANLIVALLFLESNFLDSRSKTGNIIPLFDEDSSLVKFNKEIFFEVGSALYDQEINFDQLILHMPDRKERVVPGREPAIYIGESVYPNRYFTERFAAADFDQLSYVIFYFKKHHIAITIRDDSIIAVEFLQPKNAIDNLKLKQVLVANNYLNHSGHIEGDELVIKLISTKYPSDNDLIDSIISQFTSYFSGALLEFNLPYKIEKGTEFQRRVWRILSEIPYGTVLSYEEVAERLMPDSERAYTYSRAVGSACGKNPLGILIPCHRVIGKNRSLTGFGGGVRLKGHLLDLEFIGRATK